MKLKLSEAGQRVFNAHYAQKDEKGRVVEVFEQAVYRLAAAAKAEKPEERSCHE